MSLRKSRALPTLKVQLDMWIRSISLLTNSTVVTHSRFGFLYEFGSMDDKNIKKGMH